MSPTHHVALTRILEVRPEIHRYSSERWDSFQVDGNIQSLWHLEFHHEAPSSAKCDQWEHLVGKPKWCHQNVVLVRYLLHSSVTGELQLVTMSGSPHESHLLHAHCPWMALRKVSYPGPVISISWKTKQTSLINLSSNQASPVTRQC